MNLLQYIFGYNYRRNSIETEASFQALCDFAELNKGQATTAAYLVVHRDWHTGELSLRATRKEDFGFWDKVQDFFFGTATLIHIREVVERVLRQVQPIPQDPLNIEKSKEACALLNRNITKKHPTHDELLIQEVAFQVLDPFIMHVRRSARTCRGAGLRNGGNYCFFNAALKALWAMPSFQDMVVKRLELFCEFEREWPPACVATLEGRQALASLLNDAHQTDLIDFCRKNAREERFDDRVSAQILLFLQQEKRLLERVHDLNQFITHASGQELSSHEGPLFALIQELQDSCPDIGRLLNHSQQDTAEFFQLFLLHLIPEYSITFMSPYFLNRCGEERGEGEERREEVSKEAFLRRLYDALERKESVSVQPASELPSPAVSDTPSEVIIPVVHDARRRIHTNLFFTFPLTSGASSAARSIDSLFRGYVYDEQLNPQDVASNELNRGISPATVEEYFLKYLPDIRNHPGGCYSLPMMTSHLICGASPNFLPIQILRFPDGRTKSFDQVEIPPYIRVPRVEQERGPDEVYVLRSVVIHSGSTMRSGHYYCYTPDRSSLQADGKHFSRWTEHNDKRVRPRRWSDIQSDIEQNGYLVFYERLPSSCNLS